MAFAQIKVSASDRPDDVYQNARADRLGQFAFVPSGPGTWLVQASDGQGHRVVHEVTVQAFTAQTTKAMAQPGPRWPLVLLGLSLLTNLFLAAACLWRRQRPAHGTGAQ